MFYLAEQWFMENGKVETFDTIFDPTIQADWSKVCIEAAMYSWLVIDRQDSLNKHFPDDPTVPTELSYGLVLDYFEPVMRMGCFLCQYTFKEELEGMDKSVIEDAHQYALEETIKKLSDTQSTEDIIERATRLKQTYLTTILPF
jgi:hypothetical protein